MRLFNDKGKKCILIEVGIRVQHILYSVLLILFFVS